MRMSRYYQPISMMSDDIPQIQSVQYFNKQGDQIINNMINRQFIKYPADTQKLYPQPLQTQQYGGPNPRLPFPQLLRPPSTTLIPPVNHNLSFLSPSKPKERPQNGYNDSQITINSNHNNSYITYNNYQKQLQTSRINLQRINSLTAANFLTQSQIVNNPVPQKPKEAEPILKKQGEEPTKKTFKLDPYLEQIDIIRVGLRESKGKILEQMKPMITQQVKDMYLTISFQKSNGFSNKDRVLFILAQKNHYMTLLDKLQDHFNKINNIINRLRRHDRLSPKELEQMSFTKDCIVKLLANIEKDLPMKSWKVVLQKPESKLYQVIVGKAIKEEKVLREFQDLKNREEPEDTDNQSNLSSSMLISSTHRVGSPPGLKNYSTPNGGEPRSILNQTDLTSPSRNKSEIQYKSENISLNEENLPQQKKYVNEFPDLIPKVQQPMQLARQTRHPFGELNRL